MIDRQTKCGCGRGVQEIGMHLCNKCLDNLEKPEILKRVLERGAEIAAAHSKFNKNAQVAAYARAVRQYCKGDKF